jgi:hypothetical protein
LSRTSLRRLDTSLRCQDHTTSPSATAPSSCVPDIAHGKQSALRPHCTPNAAASTASHPACLTIAKRPSSGTRRRGYKSIRTESEQEYYLLWGLTAQITPDLARRARIFFCATSFVSSKDRKDLTRRANHRYVFIMSRSQCPRRDIGRGFFVCREQAWSGRTNRSAPMRRRGQGFIRNGTRKKTPCGPAGSSRAYIQQSSVDRVRL